LRCLCFYSADANFEDKFKWTPDICINESQQYIQNINVTKKNQTKNKKPLKFLNYSHRSWRLKSKNSEVEVLDFLMGYESYLRKRRISVSSTVVSIWLWVVKFYWILWAINGHNGWVWKGWEAARAVCRTMQIYQMYNTTLLKILPASGKRGFISPARSLT
jgi:hypothetical protein